MIMGNRMRHLAQVIYCKWLVLRGLGGEGENIDKKFADLKNRRIFAFLK